jgi:CheY-like chemotaxis protein
MEFDLIILDLHLPPFNVLELSKMIREELNLNIPIIGLSSANMNGRAIEAGVNMVFRKPLDNTHIQEAICTSLFQN